MTRGDTVVVRAYGEEPLVRRVWEWTDEAVFVCNEEYYQALASGSNEWLCVGFPRRDVFQVPMFDLALLSVDKSLWSNLKLWEGGNE